MINYYKLFINLYTNEYVNKVSAIDRMGDLFEKVISFFFVAVFFILGRILSVALFMILVRLFGVLESAMFTPLHELAIFMSIFVLVVKYLIKVACALLAIKGFIKLQTTFVYCNHNVTKMVVLPKITKAQFCTCPVNQKYNS